MSRVLRQGGEFALLSVPILGNLPQIIHRFRRSAFRLGIRWSAYALGLKRFQEARCLHFLTFSGYKREPRLNGPHARDVFELTLERARKWYGFYVAGYVVMPEHVHLLITEPERAKLSLALQMLKQNVARQLHEPEGGSFWQARYYDFNVWTEAKRIEKLRYIHRNPVVRGLVASPEMWAWSSFQHYASGAEGVVEIESPADGEEERTARTPQLRV